VAFVEVDNMKRLQVTLRLDQAELAALEALRAEHPFPITRAQVARYIYQKGLAVVRAPKAGKSAPARS